MLDYSDCQNDWQIFLKALKFSLRNISDAYLSIDRFGEATPILRERAYCYELYHQLRQVLPEDFQYILHGEIDKRGQRYIKQCFNGKCPNPDFVIHEPGTMNNLAVIEVKASFETVNISNDLRKLRRFIARVAYQHGISIVFGPGEIRGHSLNPLHLRHLTILHHVRAGEVRDIYHGDDV